MKAAEQIVDFNLHDIVGIRFINPRWETAVAYTNQFAPALSPLKREPDIIVRFQDELAPPALRYAGLNFAGFTRDAFYLLDKTQGSITAQIPFEKIGQCPEIVCPANTGSIPLLRDIINFTCLSKGYIPLHASAFLYDSVGIVVMGWPKGGKTGAMLAFMNQGARYVGDEWIILSGDGQKMFGLPAPVAVSDWQFKHIPGLMPKLSAGQRILFGSIHLLEAVYNRVGNGRARQLFPIKLLKKGLPSLKRQLKITKPPQVLFKDRFDELAAAPDKLFLIMSHSQAEIDVQPCNPLTLARQMAQANEYEQKEFFDYYKAFQFSFPHLKNELLDNIASRQSTLLSRALTGKETYLVLHPYAGPLVALFERIRPFCARTISTPYLSRANHQSVKPLKTQL